MLSRAEVKKLSAVSTKWDNVNSAKKKETTGRRSAPGVIHRLVEPLMTKARTDANQSLVPRENITGKSVQNSLRVSSKGRREIVTGIIPHCSAKKSRHSRRKRRKRRRSWKWDRCWKRWDHSGSPKLCNSPYKCHIRSTRCLNPHPLLSIVGPKNSSRAANPRSPLRCHSQTSICQAKRKLKKGQLLCLWLGHEAGNEEPLICSLLDRRCAPKSQRKVLST